MLNKKKFTAVLLFEKNILKIINELSNDWIMNKLYQIFKKKIKNNDFVFIILFTIKSYLSYFLNKALDYKLEKIKFYKKLGYRLNLKDPKTFNEKIFWKKRYDRNPLLPITADKYRVRSYIRQVLGKEKAKEILITLLFVTDKPVEIPFANLPPSFIVKPNHGSGLYIIIKNGKYNKDNIIKICQRWLRTPYGIDKMEWAYQNIKRKIVIERLLQETDGSIPKDFKFHIFHGKCKLIAVICDRMSNNSYGKFFDETWNELMLSNTNNNKSIVIKKPKNYEMMLDYAEKLAEPFDYVRADFIILMGISILEN